MGDAVSRATQPCMSCECKKNRTSNGSGEDAKLNAGDVMYIDDRIRDGFALAEAAQDDLKANDCVSTMTFGSINCLEAKKEAMRRGMSCEEWEYELRHWKTEAERQVRDPMKQPKHRWKEDTIFTSVEVLKDKDGSESCSTMMDKDGWETRTIQSSRTLESLDCGHDEESQATVDATRSTWSAKETCPVYNGQMEDGKKHGYGCYEFVERGEHMQYEGEFEEDLRHGRGVLEWQDGRMYRGQFCKGKFHGSGEMKWPDGRQYVGEYFNDKKHGLGTFEWENAGRYDGYWKNGKRHGKGVYANGKGKVSQGIWANDKFVRLETQFQAEDSTASTSWS